MACAAPKATRHLPIVFVDGEPEKVEKTKQLLPDATYTTWGRIKTALPKAIARPPTNPVVPDHKPRGASRRSAKLGVKPGFKVALLGIAERLRRHAEAAAGEGHVHGAARTDGRPLSLLRAQPPRAARAPARARAGRRSPDDVAGLAEEGVGREVGPRRQRRPRRPASPPAGWITRCARSTTPGPASPSSAESSDWCLPPTAALRAQAAVSANRDQELTRQRAHGIRVFARSVT